jgi:TctA family transporter
MVVLGLLLGTVGTDVNSGVARFDFGVPELMDGINLVALAMGVFGIAEVIGSINQKREGEVKEKISMRTMTATAKKDAKDSIMPMLRGTGIGSFFGALPGTGASIASFMSYAVEKKVAKDPSRFGKGAIEGLTAPEAANNAASQTAFVPTLSLGIPGDAVMALMLGALIIHGIQPGPLLMTQQPELFWGLIVSFGIGNIMLMVLNLPLIGIWVAILAHSVQRAVPGHSGVHQPGRVQRQQQHLRRPDGGLHWCSGLLPVGAQVRSGAPAAGLCAGPADGRKPAPGLAAVARRHDDLSGMSRAHELTCSWAFFIPSLIFYNVYYVK